MTKRPGPEPPSGVAELAADYRASSEQRRQVLIQRCPICASRYFPPQLRCSKCGAQELEWEPCGSRGRIKTWVTVHGQEETASMSVPRRLKERTPYSTVFLALDDAPEIRIAALYFHGSDDYDLKVGAPMTVHLEDVDGRPVPVCIRDVPLS